MKESECKKLICDELTDILYGKNNSQGLMVRASDPLALDKWEMSDLAARLEAKTNDDYSFLNNDVLQISSVEELYQTISAEKVIEPDVRPVSHHKGSAAFARAYTYQRA